MKDHIPDACKGSAKIVGYYRVRFGPTKPERPPAVYYRVQVLNYQNHPVTYIVAPLGEVHQVKFHEGEKWIDDHYIRLTGPEVLGLVM
jgi:hypothetical protein